jgi:hypothetical protein
VPTISLNVPETLARAIAPGKDDLARRTLEGATAQAFAEGQLTHAEVAGILGLDRWETDKFLKERKAFRTTDVEEFAHDLEYLRAITK